MNNVQNEATSFAAYDDVDEAAEAILDRWTDGASPSDDEEIEATADEPVEETEGSEAEYEEDENEDQEEDEETDEDPDEGEPDDEEVDEDDDGEADGAELSDDSLVDIQVDGETKQASLKDLKRLYGQEASLTRKSQDLASKRKEADDALQRTDLSYQKLLERAETRYKPYQDLDMLVASRTMSVEDFSALRREASEAEAELKFLKEESNSFYQEVQQKQAAQRQEMAQECIKTLQETIPDWGNALYNDIREYAVSVGLPREQVDQYVDPNVITLLNKARLYDQGKAAAGTKKAKAMHVKTAKGKVLRSKKAPPSTSDINARKQSAAAQRVRENRSRNGDMDDIAEMLLSRWES